MRIASGRANEFVRVGGGCVSEIKRDRNYGHGRGCCRKRRQGDAAKNTKRLASGNGWKMGRIKRGWRGPDISDLERGAAGNLPFPVVYSVTGKSEGVGMPRGVAARGFKEGQPWEGCLHIAVGREKKSTEWAANPRSARTDSWSRQARNVVSPVFGKCLKSVSGLSQISDFLLAT